MLINSLLHQILHQISVLSVKSDSATVNVCIGLPGNGTFKLNFPRIVTFNGMVLQPRGPILSVCAKQGLPHYKIVKWTQILLFLGLLKPPTKLPNKDVLHCMHDYHVKFSKLRKHTMH